jgi:hypothetical protein
VLFGARIISLWIGHAVVTPGLLIAGLGIWKVMEAAGSALAAFLNGAQQVRLQVIAAIAVAAAAITLKIELVPLLGTAGVVWATIAAYTVCAVIPYAIFARRIVRRATDG